MNTVLWFGNSNSRKLLLTFFLSNQRDIGLRFNWLWVSVTQLAFNFLPQCRGLTLSSIGLYRFRQFSRLSKTDFSIPSICLPLFCTRFKCVCLSPLLETLRLNPSSLPLLSRDSRITTLLFLQLLRTLCPSHYKGSTVPSQTTVILSSHEKTNNLVKWFFQVQTQFQVWNI